MNQDALPSLSVGLLVLAAAAALGADSLPNEEVEAPEHVWRQVQLARDVLGSTRESVTALLGEPTAVRAETQANRHDPLAMDEVTTLTYPGVSVEIYTALRGSSNEKQLLARVVLSRPHPKLPVEAGIGATREAVLQRLGPPESATSNSLWYGYYDPGIVGTEGIRFNLRQDRVAEVEWIYSVH